MWLALACWRASGAEPIGYCRRQLAGVALHVVDVDLNDPRVVVAPVLAAGGLGRAESFSSFIRRLGPAAAVNGTFLGKRSLRPVGDVVADGRVACFGGMGTALAIASDGVDVIRLPKSRRVDWSEHRAALGGGPLLVWDGFAKPLPGGEGFADPHVFSRAAPRTAVGITRSSHLLLVTTAQATSLARLAKAMRELGAVYAINLDGGASAGMYVQGRMIRSPARRLTNVLAVHLRPQGVQRDPLRPPRGLDWRAGYKPRPVLRFTAKGLQASARLPRKWEERVSILVKADRALPQGWVVRLRVDQKTAALAGALPAEVVLDLSGLSRTAEHELWIGLVDAQGKTVGHVARVFRFGKPSRA